MLFFQGLADEQIEGCSLAVSRFFTHLFWGTSDDIEQTPFYIVRQGQGRQLLGISEIYGQSFFSSRFIKDDARVTTRRAQFIIVA